MATTILTSVPVLSLALCFIFIQTVLCRDSSVSKIYVVSHINKNPQVSLNCTTGDISGFSQWLTPGKEYSYTQANKYSDSYCVAKWGRFFLAFEGWSYTRDSGKAIVYWKVDEASWFLSYDNSKFIKIEDWETE